MAGLTSSCRPTEPPALTLLTPFVLTKLNCPGVLIAYCREYKFCMSPRVSGVFN